MEIPGSTSIDLRAPNRRSHAPRNGECWPRRYAGSSCIRQSILGRVFPPNSQSPIPPSLHSSNIPQSEHITTNAGREDAHGFLYSEMDWYRARLYRLVALLRGMYGEDVPLMLRTRHMRLSATYRQWGVLMIQQLDQAARSVAQQMGVRLFTWGDRLEGYQE